MKELNFNDVVISVEGHFGNLWSDSDEAIVGAYSGKDIIRRRYYVQSTISTISVASIDGYKLLKVDGAVKCGGDSSWLNRYVALNTFIGTTAKTYVYTDSGILYLSLGTDLFSAEHPANSYIELYLIKED